MSQRSKEEIETIDYYNRNWLTYVNATVNLQVDELYVPFLELVPKGGKILDAGCGSGRDSKAFLELGYSVTSVDASHPMVEATRILTGKAAAVLRMQDMEFENEFDGIWACASLLHIPQNEIADVLERFHRALRSVGVCYLSFKQRSDTRLNDGRHFLDFSEEELISFLNTATKFKILKTWKTVQETMGSFVYWTNALISTEERLALAHSWSDAALFADTVRNVS